YPGVSDSKQAIEIAIGKGDIREDLEFKLPPTVETQTIKGKVVWPDGKPVAKAWVYLTCPVEVEAHESKIKLSETESVTDAEGNFTFTGFKGVSYSLKVVAQTGDPNRWSEKNLAHAPLLRLILADEPIELRLILSEPGYGTNCDDDKRRQK